MENKLRSFIGGRVALSDSERRIETTTNQNYFAYMVVSIRRTNAAYSTTAYQQRRLTHADQNSHHGRGGT